MKPSPRLAALEGAHDAILVRRAREGDAGAFGALVQRWQGMVFGLAYRMTGRRDTAEELSQDVFLRAFQRLDDWEGSARFSTWLYVIARNLCLDDRKRRRPPESAESADAPSRQPSPEDDVAGAEDARTLQSLLLALPVTQREAFVLRHIEGLDYEEIAERCGTTVNNVKVRVHRARATLAKAFTGEDDDVAR